jgi:MtN3 and saliva related transmembrane protein
MLITAIGATAALFTTVSYVPQLKKCRGSGKADDLSLKTFVLLATGIALWVAYGVLKQDMAIIAANSVSLFLLGCILYFKLRRARAP